MFAIRPGLLATMTLVAAGCGSLGPYPPIGQKLDVNVRISAPETWIAVGGEAGDEIRILVLGQDAGGIPTFSHSVLYVPIGAGLTARTMQGVWAESGSQLTLTEQTQYDLPNERSQTLTERHGSVRSDGLNVPYRLTAARTADRLVLAGDPSLSGTYIPVSAALGHLGTSTPEDAACAYYVMNLAVMTGQVRIVGFGSNLMLQYSNAETFQSTLSGDIRISLSGGLGGADIGIVFQQSSDFGGVQIDGTQSTNSDTGGNGKTTGTLRFTYQRDLAPMTGSVVYDLNIGNGFATDGQYHITIDGGATGTATPEGRPAPSVATCLGLP